MVGDESVKEKNEVDTSRYAHAKIYKLVSNQTDKIYFGSSCNLLRIRLAQHKSSYKQWLAGKRRYVTSFEIAKYDDCNIILVEEISYQTKEQLSARER